MNIANILESVLLALVLILVPIHTSKMKQHPPEVFKFMKPDIVTVTTYTIQSAGIRPDTISTTTASGFEINERNPRAHRIIAISRDLRKKYGFGQKVRIEGTGIYDGIYVVRDLMDSRWRKRIDILINDVDKQIKIYNVKIYKLLKKQPKLEKIA